MLSSVFAMNEPTGVCSSVGVQQVDHVAVEDLMDVAGPQEVPVIEQWVAHFIQHLQVTQSLGQPQRVLKRQNLEFN